MPELAGNDERPVRYGPKTELQAPSSMVVFGATAGRQWLRLQASSSDGDSKLLMWRVLLDNHRRLSKKLHRKLQWRKEKMRKRKKKKKNGKKEVESRWPINNWDNSVCRPCEHIYIKCYFNFPKSYFPPFKSHGLYKYNIDYYWYWLHILTG